MTLITAQNGHALLELHIGNTLNIPSQDQNIPMPLALVVAKHEGKVLFIFNTWRKVWELPGGIIDEGETPKEAAIRELAEESGQVVPDVHYVGWMKFRLKPDDHLELGILYSCELKTIQPFIANEEASKIILWDMIKPLEEDISEIDVYIAKHSMQ